MLSSCSRIALTVTASLTLLASAHAFSAQRTFVSTTGVDNPACSLVAQCRTFAAAIAATSPNGEVIVLDSGGYGKVTITQSVSIIAAPGVYAGISVVAPDQGVTVDAGATDKVVLRGLTIKGQARQGGNNGIRILSAGQVYIERCIIADMGSSGVQAFTSGSVFILDSLVSNSFGPGVYIGGGEVRVNDSRFVENNIGLLVYTGTLIASRIVVENNIAGGVVAAGIFEGAFVTLIESVLSGNGGVGASAGRGMGFDTGPVEMRVIRSTVSNNGFEGFQINGQEGFRSFVLSDSAVVRNGQGDSGAGVALVGEVRATITGSTIEANAGHGIFTVGSTTVVSGSTVSHNGAAGLIAANAGTAIVSGSTLAANALADLSQTGAAVLLSSGTNTLTGRGAADISGTITPNPRK